MKKALTVISLLIIVLNSFAQESRWRKLNADDIFYDTKTLKKTKMIEG